MAQAAGKAANGKQKAAQGFPNTGMPSFDFEEGLSAYRKNMEVLASMGKTSMDLYQNLAKLQMGFFQQMMADANQSFKNSLNAKNVSECLAHGKSFTQGGAAKAAAHAKNLSQEMSAGSTKIVELAKNHTKDQTQRFREKLKKPKH
ncbi:MAG: phasin family protein [Holosporales bacterium]|jgi:phasin family protein|nr:phasin family protein [Holosporales bacterium]